MARASGGLPSSRRHFSLWQTFTDVSTFTAESIAQVHQTGLPWYVTIPLVAAGINFSVRLPLQWYHRILHNRRAKVQPFVEAWGYRHHHEVAKDHFVLGEKVRNYEKAKRLGKSRKRIYKTFHCQYWKSVIPLLGSIPFLTISDSLRRLSGLTEPYTLTDNPVLIDPSITEGGLAWFTDLTAQDPFLILPAACSAVLASSIYRGVDQKTLKEYLIGRDRPLRTGFGDVIRRITFFIPIVPLLLFQNPAAMFLYWLTTFSLSHFNTFILDLFISRPKRTLNVPTQDGVKFVKPWVHSSALEQPKTDSAASKSEGA